MTKHGIKSEGEIPEWTEASSSRQLSGRVFPSPRGHLGSNQGHQDDDEFNGFFRKEYPRVVKVVMYAGATLEESEDAVSSAMAQAYARWPWLTQPNAWVRKVALRNYLKKVTKDRRRGQLEMRAARRDCLDRVPVGALEEPDERSRVIAVLRCLPPVQLTAMALTLDGYTPTEIAQMLHQRADTVRSNLRYARRRLRDELENPAGGQSIDDRTGTGLD